MSIWPVPQQTWPAQDLLHPEQGRKVWTLYAQTDTFTQTQRPTWQTKVWIVHWEKMEDKRLERKTTLPCSVFLWETFLPDKATPQFWFYMFSMSLKFVFIIVYQRPPYTYHLFKETHETTILTQDIRNSSLL